MDTLKGIMIKYANERGGGLPLTPEEICNCVVLWVQQYAPTAITINGGEGVSINNELVDDNKKVITININTDTIGGGGSGGTGLFVHTYSMSNYDFKFKILTPISTSISPVGFSNEGVLGAGKSKAIKGSAYVRVRNTSTREWKEAFGFTDDKGTTFYVLDELSGSTSTYGFRLTSDGPMDAFEYIETIEPFTGGNM